MHPGNGDHDDGTTMSALLERSAPATPFADAVADDTLRQAVRGARRGLRRRWTRRLTPRAVALGTVIALGLGGAGVATAASISGWQSWAQSPDYTTHFTLPSGAHCEYRLVVRGGDPAEVASIRDYLRTADLIGQANIYAELQRQAGHDVSVVGDDGKVDRTARATEVESADEIYLTAVEGAIQSVVWDEVAGRGFSNPMTGSDLWFSSQPDCPGADLPGVSS